MDKLIRRITGDSAYDKHHVYNKISQLFPGAEIITGCNTLNKFASLGMPKTYKAA